MKQSLNTPRGEILLREANPKDAVQFRDLRLYALQDTPTAFSADYQRNLSHSPQYWEDLLTFHTDESTILLAQHQSELIGMTGIARGNTPKTRHSATIWGVYVRPECRGLHIAEELIHSCFAWARARKIVAARLGVTQRTPPRSAATNAAVSESLALNRGPFITKVNIMTFT